MKVVHCQGTTKSGQPCNAKPLPDDTLCPWHSPAWATKRAEWSAKGGAQRSNKARAKKQLPAEPLTTAELHSYLGVIFKGLIAGKMEPNVATAAANVARTMTELVKTSELEGRMDEIERKLRGQSA